MKRTFIFLMLSLLLLPASSCDLKKGINWNVSLSARDKKPYGSYLARAALPLLFPDSRMVDLSPGFRYGNIDARMMKTAGGHSLMVALGLDFYLTEGELLRLVNYVSAGNELFIFARTLDARLEKYLQWGSLDQGEEEIPLKTVSDGAINQSCLRVSADTGRYGYRGRSIQAFLAPLPADTSTNKPSQNESVADLLQAPILRDTIGWLRKRPNILRFQIGSGYLTIHTAPLAMSNYFLLQGNNRQYLEGLFSHVKGTPATVYWNDYYRRTAKASDLGILWRYPETRWAFIITAFAALVYLFFESKRRQRILPEIAPPVNSSVSFVETVGRLYYNRGQHGNLAEKMVQHFLEWLRTHYFINTNHIDDRFRQQILVRSGLSENIVDSMIELIHEVQQGKKEWKEEDLYFLHRTIEQFRKNK